MNKMSLYRENDIEILLEKLELLKIMNKVLESTNE